MPDQPTNLLNALESAPRRLVAAPENVLADQLEAARQIIRSVEARPPTGPLDDPMVSDEFERIRWFPLPGEGLKQLRASIT